VTKLAQRLGGLQLPSSRDALHRVIEKGDDAEQQHLLETIEQAISGKGIYRILTYRPECLSI
jgi:hypothetical protein